MVITSVCNAEGPWFDSGRKHIFYLHSSSAAKKVQNQIHPGTISHVHQKCVFTLPLQQKKYKIKFTHEEYHMYIKNASSLLLCSKKSTKSNLPRMNLTCTSKMRLHSSSAAKKVQYQILKFLPLATKILWCSGYHICLQCRRTLVQFQAKILFLSSLLLCSKKSTKSNLPRMNLKCTSKMRLHSSSAAKKVQY